MLILFIVLFSVVTTLSNFQVTFPLISPKVFGILTPNFTTKVRKINGLTFGNKNQSGFGKELWMMLWTSNQSHTPWYNEFNRL